MNVLDLFSGIGGFSLGLERAGFRTVAFCEIDPYARRVLAKHWPEVPCYDDVRTLTAERLKADGISVDVICGGFPCQDISVAGKRAGINTDTRSGLWSEIARLTSELRPRVVIVENVSNLLSGPSEQPGGWFGRILGDLAEIGYDAEWHCIPASYVGAPHRRDRIWVVAYATGCNDGIGYSATAPGQEQEPRGCGFAGDVSDANSKRLEGAKFQWLGQRFGEGVSDRCGWEPEPDVGRVANGVPSRVDRLRCLGNAVVPQIPGIIGRAIMECVR